jgi:acetolactate synthase-1/3 small subunit
MDRKYIFSIEVEDKPMVLTRISSLVARRGFSIDSLTVANTNKKGISRFTIVVQGNDKTLEQIRKQTQKIIHVLTTSELREEDSVIRELAILKLHYLPQNIKKINHIIDFYGARMLDSTEDVFMIEVSGTTEKIDTIIKALGDNIILESIRTGKMGLRRGLKNT